MARIALLYPTRNAGEDDFTSLAGRLRPALDLEVRYFPWPADVGDLSTTDVSTVADAVRRLGSDEHLTQVIPGLAAGFDVVAFAVTSASFLVDPDHQLLTVSRLTGAPATSTTRAFQQAIHVLDLDKVALASVYHPSFSDHFISRLDVHVVNRVDASVGSDRQLAAWSADQIVDLVAEAAHPQAQAVLLPETALHTSGLTAELERAAGCPVLTATQVTLWSAARLLDLHPAAPDAGPLFRR
ncbi:decarboxylase [Amycolatopsis rhabdoformis]|uniref:Decarboxylase n=1 Tax=Amycolatopsis rhabdoformis TaxID=1448059 RepID=A0ABZ1HZ49_9PSEU|nr:decarboxylase [Amycolatopsis rhabdoformis]WSE27432.1 decarboxylase [Amycolatopsis rhabdoformis]